MMISQPKQPLPHFETQQYGAVDFEGQHVPCAFGGQPGMLTAYILVEGVCQIIGIPVEGEIARIQSNHLLSDGLGMVSFPMLTEEGKTIRSNQPAISLMRLHTWLALIPPDIVSSDKMRDKLIATQTHFTDVVYAYFGRRILPAEIRTEDDPYIDPDRKKLYDMLESASRFDDRLSKVEGKVEELLIAISTGEEGDYISADQQEQLRAMIDLISNRYEQKHGKGTRGTLISDIKQQHNFRFYNGVTKKAWPALVRDCVSRYRQLSPSGSPLPRVFQIALDSVEQKSLF
jgi:hypothetical protein